MEHKFWSKDEATEQIRRIANSDRLTLSYKRHAVERLIERSLIVSDLLYVLKFGLVLKDPIQSTRPRYFKYAIECKCPNSANRDVRVVVIPDKATCELKIISIMWVDEQSTRAGNMIGRENE